MSLYWNQTVVDFGIFSLGTEKDPRIQTELFFTDFNSGQELKSICGETALRRGKQGIFLATIIQYL